ncbi:MAG: beta-hydroxyacyl-ACP dehydratase [Planctomycetes bacterium]|nr:beta-hydroxyacyl-ACP dehydratase [Planctomycetota bacterium]
MRWIWIDRFVKFEPRKSARALKNLSLAEDYFEQHLPGYPIMPACFILEGLAQTGGILVGEANDFKEKVVLAKITSARFEREAVAGEVLIYDTEMVTLRPEGASIAGKVYAFPAGSDIPGELSAPPMAEAEIFFAHLDQSRSQQIFGDHNFVFSGELKHLLGLAKVTAQRTDSAKQ